MSGFLHQLAARSLGLAPEARPRAALPYAAPTMAALNETSSALQPAPASLTRETPRPESSAPKAPGRNFKPDVKPDDAEPTPLAGRSSANKSASERAVNTSAPPSPAGSEALPVFSSRGPLLSSPPTDLHAGQRDDPTDPLSPPAAATNQRAEAAPAQGGEPGESRQAGRIADLENLVSRLLRPETKHGAMPPEPEPSSAIAPPTTARPTTGSTRRPSSRSERPANLETDPLPEVHITIGRLEVSPPSRPAPPPAPHPRGPAPLSLADYLTRRSGGRS